MEEQNNGRTRWLHLRLTPKEYELLYKRFNKTTCRKLSDYARRILFEKPVVTTYRNRSMDDFMTEMIRLRKELNCLGNNFNQVVKKLYLLSQTEDICALLAVYETDKKILQQKVEAIQLFIEKNAQSW